MSKYRVIEYNDNNLAITYSRYSSNAQNEESIEQQQKRCREYAQAHGYTVVREYADFAMSGQDASRPQYQMMLSELKKIKPAVLIMWKNDRLGREVLQLQIAKHAIRQAGCKIELVSEIAPDTDTSQGRFIGTIMDGASQFWSDTSRENIKRSQMHMAESGKSLGHRILGYKVGVDRKYEVDPDTAPIVVRIFNEYADGKPMQTIANELNAQGVRSIRGNKFTVNGLRSVLHNDRYTGVYRYGKIRIEDGMPVLIDETLFEKVQNMFRVNKRATHSGSETHRYWLSGKLYCGHCGEAMQGVSGTSKTKGRKHFYYYCANRRKKKKCDKKNVRAEEVESIVINILNELLSDSENLASLAVDAYHHYKKNHEEVNYLEVLESGLKNTETSLRNLVKAIEQGIFSESTQARLMELEEEKKSLTEAIKVEKFKKDMAKDEHSIQMYFEKYLHIDFRNTEMRDAVLEYFIDKIYVHDDKVCIMGNYSDEEYSISFEEYEAIMETGGRGFNFSVLGSTSSPLIGGFFLLL